MSCKCQKCGKQYKIDLIVPDEIWVKIKLKKTGGLLCGSCIMVLMEHLGYNCYSLCETDTESKNNKTIHRINW